MRMMVVFEKGAALRYIGHLDLMRTIQRSMRRSLLPIMYSNGFNPHIRLSFAAPLSVGVVGLHELMEVPLEDGITPEHFISAMNAVLPCCLQVKACRALQDKTDTLMSMVAGSRYTIAFKACDDAKAALAKLPEFMALKEYIAIRKTKSGENPCDIRSFVKEEKVTESPEGFEIHLETICNAAGALKPSLWLECLCAFASVKPFPCVIYRDAILSTRSDGMLVPMEALENV